MPEVTELLINGKSRALRADSERTLLSVLRDDLALTGAKYGCGEGECGACTVLIDGSPVRSCQRKISALAGKKITTIEGLEVEGRLHPLQKAFVDADALQCAFCTPGMIMAGVALLGKNPNPSRDQVLQAMEGNICRCGVYSRILDAFERVQRKA